MQEIAREANRGEPRGSVEAMSSSHNAPPVPVEPLPVRQRKGISILVVDDLDVYQDLLVRFLESFGHKVTSASNSHAALEMLEHEEFELVITDIFMPEGDGFGLIMKLHERWPKVRVLAISAGGEFLDGNDSIRTARALGAHAAIKKPFTPPELLEGISRACGVRSEA